MPEPNTVEAPEAATTTESPVPYTGSKGYNGTPVAWRGAKGPQHLPRTKYFSKCVKSKILLGSMLIRIEFLHTKIKAKSNVHITQ